MNIDNDELIAQFILLFYGAEALQEYRNDKSLVPVTVHQAVNIVVKRALAAQRQVLRDEVEKAIVSFIHPSVATTPEAQKAINTAISTIFEGKG